jgi:hypothetical protein
MNIIGCTTKFPYLKNWLQGVKSLNLHREMEEANFTCLGDKTLLTLV